MPTIQFTHHRPISERSFYNKMRNPKSRCFFPKADLNDLRASYETYKRSHYDMITLPQCIKMDEITEKIFKAGQKEREEKGDKAEGKAFKLLFFMSGNKILPGIYEIKINSWHNVKKSLRFKITENDIRKRHHYVQVASLILPRLPPSMRPVPVRRSPAVRPLSIRDVFERR